MLMDVTFDIVHQCESHRNEAIHVNGHSGRVYLGLSLFCYQEILAEKTVDVPLLGVEAVEEKDEPLTLEHAQKKGTVAHCI